MSETSGTDSNRGYFIFRRTLTPRSKPRVEWNNNTVTPYQAIDNAIDKPIDWATLHLRSMTNEPIPFNSSCASVIKSGEELMLHTGLPPRYVNNKRSVPDGAASGPRFKEVKIERTNTSLISNSSHNSNSNNVDIKNSNVNNVGSTIKERKIVVANDLEAATTRRATKQTELFGILASCEALDDAKHGKSVKEALMGRFGHYVPANFFALGAMAVQAVVKVRMLDGKEASGFLISSAVLMTNNHVLPSIEVAKIANIQFNHENSVKHETLHHTKAKLAEAKLDPSTLFYTDVNLDYTIVAIETTANSSKKRPYLFLHSNEDLDALSPINDSGLFVVQHPNGREKEANVRGVRYDLKVKEHPVYKNNPAASSYFFYTNDTEYGSSGSPVCNKNWMLIGLHMEFVKHAENATILCNAGVLTAAIATSILSQIRAKIETIVIADDENQLLQQVFSHDHNLSERYRDIMAWQEQ